MANGEQSRDEPECDERLRPRQGLPLMSVQWLEGRPTFFINIEFELPGERLSVTYRLDNENPSRPGGRLTTAAPAAERFQ